MIVGVFHYLAAVAERYADDRQIVLLSGAALLARLPAYGARQASQRLVSLWQDAVLLYAVADRGSCNYGDLVADRSTHDVQLATHGDALWFCLMRYGVVRGDYDKNLACHVIRCADNARHDDDNDRVASVGHDENVGALGNNGVVCGSSDGARLHDGGANQIR